MVESGAMGVANNLKKGNIMNISKVTIVMLAMLIITVGCSTNPIESKMELRNTGVLLQEEITPELFADWHLMYKTGIADIVLGSFGHPKNYKIIVVPPEDTDQYLKDGWIIAK